MSMSGKIITLVCVIAILAAGSVGYATMERLQKELTLHAQQQVRHTTQQVSHKLEQGIALLMADVRTLAADPALLDLAELARGVPHEHGDVHAHKQRMAQIFTNLLQQRADYQQIRLIGLDEDGRELIRIKRQPDNTLTQVAPADLQTQGQRSYFKRTIILPKNQVYLSEINLSRENQVIVSPHMPVIRASMPLFDHLGETFGLLVINLDLSRLLADLQHQTPGQSMHLFNHHGYLLASSPPQAELQNFGFEFNQPPLMLTLYPVLAQQLNHSAESAFTLVAQDAPSGTHELLGVQTLYHNPNRPDQRLVITVSMPYQKIFTTLYSSRDESLLIGGGMLLMALLLAVLLTRSLTHPLRAMIRAVEDTAHDQGRHALPVGVGGEMGILAKAFAQMLQRTAEQNAAQADHRANQLLEATDVGVFGIDDQGLVSFINPAAERMLGYSREALLGKNIHSMVHHAYADGTPYPEHACRMSAALREQREYHVTDEVLWKQDGSPFYVTYSSIPLWQGDQRSGAVITFWDTTEQRQDEQKLIAAQQEAELIAAEERALEALFKLTLQESATTHYLEEVLEALIHSVPWLKLKPVGGLFLTDESAPQPQLKLVVNHNLDPELKQRCAKVPFGTCLCGLAAQSGTLQFASCMDHRHVITFEGITAHGHYNVPIMDGAQVLGVMVLYLAHGHEQKERETAFLARAGHIISMGLMRRRAAKELSCAKQRAERANHAKSDFLATMSHEIRNPMNAIIALSHLALEQSHDQRQRDYLSKIHTAGQSLLRIINDILDFSKIEAGKLEIEQTDFQLDDVLSNLATLTAVKAQEKQIELIFDKAPALPHALRGDPLRLSQILLNVVGNAIKFTEQGEVEMSITRHTQRGELLELCFTVRDTGIGMNEAQIAELFRPYQQAESSTSRRFGGSGLGLSISHQLVTLMNGTIQVSSTPGVGSQFVITLPFAVLPDRPESLVIPKLLTGQVVVASANQRMCDVVAENLGRFGLTCASVGAMSTLHQWLENNPLPRFMVLDADMLPVSMAQDLELLLNPMLHRFVEGGVLMLHGYQTQQAVMDLAAKDARVGAVQKPVTSSSLYDGAVQLLGVGSLSDAQHAPVQSNASPTTWPQLTGRHMLVAEDNAINQQIIQELLSKVGVNVTLVNNGFEAVEKANPLHHDAILMDLHMPLMDGFEATTQIRQRFGNTLPIFAMTASSTPEDQKQVQQSGMNGHLTKPIDPVLLYTNLSQWLGEQPPKPPSVSSPQPAQPQPADSLQSVPGQPGQRSPAGPPNIPGINYTLGLQQLGGDAELYHQILLAFEQDQRETSAKLIQLLEAGDLAALEPLVHTLKGLLGSVGAERLRARVIALETSLKMAQPKENIAALIQTMQAELAPMLAAIAQLHIKAGR
ncbi:PAS/PAC sensor hybrid histidine kinase [Magnetococcus marinus MC-1]|uniref:Sensory/regulatory protein RpfC n=1 Tax=Magnetococcus marinus (strain ATCC BAA-1437 / JCM 17883 / MC-1) TaxID=156889 RepID=A0LCY7_MAGMM|nr:ATP-binding protein [Magnetococcus marinus]ABK45830.1 PAS/PAC sensor hybrid histidine kinase [Magnetococcus marinus MC-1]